MLNTFEVPDQRTARPRRGGAGDGFTPGARVRLGVVGCGAVLAVVVVLAAPVRVAWGRPSPRAAALTTAITRVMRQESIPGAIVGVWRRGAAPYVRAFGVRDTATGQSMSTNLRMRIGSVSKTFTGTALLQLVDQGKISLDSPISKYIAGVPHGNEITIRELAEMRSGLFDYFGNDAWVRAWLADPGANGRPGAAGLQLQQTVAVCAGHELRLFERELCVARSGDPEGVPRAAGHLHRAAHSEARAPDAHQLPGRGRVPVPARAGLHRLDGRMPLLAQVREDRQRHRLDMSPTWAAGAMVSTLGDLHRSARDVATGSLLTQPPRDSVCGSSPCPV